jgi:hypothetical protein
MLCNIAPWHRKLQLRNQAGNPTYRRPLARGAGCIEACELSNPRLRHGVWWQPRRLSGDTAFRGVAPFESDVIPIRRDTPRPVGGSNASQETPFDLFVCIGTMNRSHGSLSNHRPTILPFPAGEGRGEGESFERESRAVHGEGELSERERRSVHGEGGSFEPECPIHGKGLRPR